jgi:hypothetical protein
MTIIAFAVAIAGTGLIAKVFPKAMTRIFERYPQHFRPRTYSQS